MSKENIHNEWDPLEEMIVGIADGARVPSSDRGLFALDYCQYHDAPADIPSGPYEPRIIEEAKEDLEDFVAALQRHGVIVRRPSLTDHTKKFGTPEWATDGEYNYCPRDVLLPIGSMIIEVPMALRSRYFEPFAYRQLLQEYFDSGAQWISAPKPRLPDCTYRIQPTCGSVLANREPIFDAANVIRMGRDILYLVSCSGNLLGCQWLQRVLGEGYRVHPLEGLYEGTYLDTTITLVRPGLGVLCPERIRKDKVPKVFKKWDIIWCPKMVDTGHARSYPRASLWQGMNFIMINPGLAVVNDLQIPLIRELEKHSVDVLRSRMRHARSLSGGFHCASGGHPAQGHTRGLLVRGSMGVAVPLENTAMNQAETSRYEGRGRMERWYSRASVRRCPRRMAKRAAFGLTHGSTHSRRRTSRSWLRIARQRGANEMMQTPRGGLEMSTESGGGSQATATNNRRWRRVLLSTVSSDAHTWNLVFLQLFLEESGYEVICLGPCVPDDLLLMRAILDQPDAIVISSVNGHGRLDGARVIRRLRVTPAIKDIPTVIGGKLGIGRDDFQTKELLDAGFDAVFTDASELGQLDTYLARLPQQTIEEVIR